MSMRENRWLRTAQLVCVLAAGLAAAALLGTSGSAATAPPLTAIGCIGDVDAKPAGCTDVTAHIAGGEDVVVSDDGTSAYTSSSGPNNDVLETFHRASGGLLTPSGCVGGQGLAPANCISIPDINVARRIVLDPAVNSLYLATYNGPLDEFARAKDGSIAYIGCIDAPVGGDPSCGATAPVGGGAGGFAISADGRSVYLASWNSVEVIQNDAAGRLTQTGCIGDTNRGPKTGCTFGNELADATDLALTPDGKTLYATSLTGLVSFSRALNGAIKWTSCLGNTGLTTTCAATAPVGTQSRIAVSPDGTNLYVANKNWLQEFTIASDGALTPSGCVGDQSAGAPASCQQAAGFQNISDVAVSPDGNAVYASSFKGSDVWSLARAADGSLTATGCLSDPNVTPAVAPSSCAPAPGLKGAISIAVSPDSKNVYVVGSSALTEFAVAPATSTSTSTSTSTTTSTSTSASTTTTTTNTTTTTKTTTTTAKPPRIALSLLGASVSTDKQGTRTLTVKARVSPTVTLIVALRGKHGGVLVAQTFPRSSGTGTYPVVLPHSLPPATYALVLTAKVGTASKTAAATVAVPPERKG